MGFQPIPESVHEGNTTITVCAVIEEGNLAREVTVGIINVLSTASIGKLNVIMLFVTVQVKRACKGPHY